MSLAQRITDLQMYIGNKQAELEAHLAALDDSNVRDSDMEKAILLNAQIAPAVRWHAILIDAEKNLSNENMAIDARPRPANGRRPNGGDVQSLFRDITKKFRELEAAIALREDDD
jgi:hypothetical protein